MEYGGGVWEVRGEREEWEKSERIYQVRGEELWEN